MMNSKYFSFSLLLLAEAIERFSYYFVSFVILFYLMTNQDNGGLGGIKQTILCGKKQENEIENVDVNKPLHR